MVIYSIPNSSGGTAAEKEIDRFNLVAGFVRVVGARPSLATPYGDLRHNRHRFASFPAYVQRNRYVVCGPETG